VKSERMKLEDADDGEEKDAPNGAVMPQYIPGKRHQYDQLSRDEDALSLS
jgi:hypothetical protein